MIRHASASTPGSVDRLNNTANALWLADDARRALPLAQEAVHAAPFIPTVHRCLGNIQLDLGNFQEAFLAFFTSFQLDRNPAAAVGCSQALIGLSAYRQAYEFSEYRLLRPSFVPYRPHPFWLGWPNCTELTVWGEQGFGDIIQNMRWLEPLIRKGYRVTLELESPLVQLAKNGLSWLGSSLVVVSKQPVPPPLKVQACHGPLQSLPWLLGVTPRSVCGSYGLRFPESSNQRSPSAVLKIGLTWESGRYFDGKVQAKEHKRKSLNLYNLELLLQCLRSFPVSITSLQHGFRPCGSAFEDCIDNYLPINANFFEQAALMQQQDLIISVDTATAHLAGAMGLHVWTLLPWAAEARWHRNSVTSDLYPTMRLVRQASPGDWDSVIRKVRVLLGLLLSQVNTKSTPRGWRWRSSQGD